MSSYSCRLRTPELQAFAVATDTTLSIIYGNDSTRLPLIEATRPKQTAASLQKRTEGAVGSISAEQRHEQVRHASDSDSDLRRAGKPLQPAFGLRRLINHHPR